MDFLVNLARIILIGKKVLVRKETIGVNYGEVFWADFREKNILLLIKKLFKFDLKIFIYTRNKKLKSHKW
jgi:hypothetical protein